ncbi:LPXTG cell wall anchor domain-containing protein [Streptomonospora salina]|uniref:LPXTG-motif cell wall-anchored protein n=1 Tax=Streptomonospora salina TaxID=104205 RepID=A0A841EAA0_9ACTN|nr:LPXTG cell wall anchor domain-containing protein [Streptomonospora salina]MBB5997993.1 LPXTG-motif cell wall-anchored protein [Streptomonospora salina]
MSHGHWLKNTARLAGGALLIGSVSLALGGTAAADATASHGDKKKGNNGSVKVHDAATEEWLSKNEPKVCEFYIVGRKFDAAQEVSWQVLEWKPTGDKGTVAAEGSLVLDDGGHGRTDDIELPDGHYRVTWEFEGKDQLTGTKHKMLWVECGDGETPPPPDGDETTPPPDGDETTPPPDGDETTPPPDGDETTPPPEEGETSPPPDDGQTPPPEDDEGTAPAPDDGQTPGPGGESEPPEGGDAAPPAGEGSDEGLPVTGAALTGLVAVGVAAVAGGGTAVYFGRRKKAEHAGE